MNRPWLELRVVSRQAETDDIVSLVLASPDGGELPPFSAGSHLDVEVAPGLVRQYSLCNNPRHRDHYEIAVLREPASRGGSAALHDGFRPLDPIRVSEPRNLFPLKPATGAAMLVAGGIGITPLLCMAERLSALGAPFVLHYCTRSETRTAFRQRIAASPFAGQVAFHFDDGPEAQRFDPMAMFAAAEADAHAYVCGPPGFIDWVLASAKEAGFPAERMHREYFQAAPAEPAPGGDRPFQLRLASSGRTIDVGADETAAAALARHGIEVPLSCEQGVCGTCITRVIEGEPDHRDMLMLDGNDEFTPCCSRALSALLVIDL